MKQSPPHPELVSLCTMPLMRVPASHGQLDIDETSWVRRTDKYQIHNHIVAFVSMCWESKPKAETRTSLQNKSERFCQDRQ